MSASANSFAVRPDWLETHHEEALYPAQLIVDAHHHLYERPDLRYLLDDYLADTSGGHAVGASVFVQARSMLRATGPEELRAIGETEFVNGVAAMSASGVYGPSRICAGIVGFADLTRGDAARAVLERHIMVAGGLASEGGRFCGIRQTLCWDDDTALLNASYPTSANMMQSDPFRTGFALLAPLGLSFDAWAFFPQLQALAKLAQAFPDTPIAVNHCGGILRVRGYGERRDIFDTWRQGIAELAQCPNVTMKLSGLGMRISAFGFDEGERAPASSDLANAWRPWIEACLERFGAQRCMWGSNFPVDKGSYSFTVGLNAFKRLLSSASDGEKDWFFHRTASQFYRLSIDGAGV